jgi:hypothetical protein
MRATIALVLAVLPIASALSQPVPAKVLARPTVQFAEPFSDIRSIRELADGRAIVVDRISGTVLLVDFNAGSTRPIGRNGDGPGEYRLPASLSKLPGDSTLLRDARGGRLLVIRPDGTPGDFIDPNRGLGDDVNGRAFRLHVRTSDESGRLYGEMQPIRIGSDGRLELTDSAAVVRLDRATGRRDTVTMFPERHDANARLLDGMVLTQPRMSAFAAWDHWLVADDGTVAKVFQDPYRVEFVFDNGRTVVRAIPYEKVRVDNALRAQHRAERAAVRIGRIGLKPTSWPEFLPPFLGSAMFGPDGLLWIPRTVGAGQPPLYDIIDRDGDSWSMCNCLPGTSSSASVASPCTSSGSTTTTCSTCSDTPCRPAPAGPEPNLDPQYLQRLAALPSGPEWPAAKRRSRFRVPQ